MKNVSRFQGKVCKLKEFAQILFSLVDLIRLIKFFKKYDKINLHLQR